ncbi:MAG: type II secretion system F family protein [Planctomycetota bacterium]
MPLFKYEAINGKGSNVTATIDALTEPEAASKVHNLDLYLTRITLLKPAKKESTPAAGLSSRRKHTSAKVRAKVITEFAGELATLQEAGLPILASLRSLQEQEKSRTFKKIIGGIADDIEGGVTLSEAMAWYPGCFDRLFVGMIAAGEKGGVLELILVRIAEFMEKAERLKSRVKSAMIYPSVVLGFAFGVTLFLMTFVIPRLESILTESGRELNVLTRTVFGIASWVANDFGWLVLIGIPLGLVVLARIVRRFQMGRVVLGRIILKIPVLGELIRRVSIARWTRTLGTLLGAGVPILDAIAVTSRATGQEVYARMLLRVAESIRQGETFSGPVRQSKLVPASAVKMISVGEESGELDRMLLKVADKFDERVDIQVAALVSLMEPLVIILLGIIVLFIVLAVMLAIIPQMQPM